MPYKDKETQAIKVRESYLRNKEKYKARDQEVKAKAKEKLRLLKSVPCADCKIQYPYYVMDFDHVNGEKLGDVSKFITNRQYQKAWDEIEKCEVVCSNCHRIRSWERMSAAM